MPVPSLFPKFMNPLGGAGVVATSLEASLQTIDLEADIRELLAAEVASTTMVAAEIKVLLTAEVDVKDLESNV